MSVKLHEKFQAAFADATDAGHEAVDAATVTPMVVGTPKDLVGSLMGSDDGGFDTSQPMYYVADGVCGFAWVNVKAKSTEGRKFLNWLKGSVKSSRPLSDVRNANDVSEPYADNYYKGVSIWVRVGNQSMQKKEVFGRAFAESLMNSGVDGISAYCMSRMD